MAQIDGMGTDVPYVANANGGRQSNLKYAFTLVDPSVMFALARILHEGALSHGTWNWRRIPAEDHLNHALAHIYAWLEGDTQDDHLGHAFCRLMMAKSMEINPGEDPRMKPGD